MKTNNISITKNEATVLSECIAAIAMDDYTQITQDYKLQQVLSLLKNHSDETRETLNIILGNNLSNRPIKIMFYNLSRMNIAYEKYDALTCKHKNGTLYIFINSIHRNAL